METLYQQGKLTDIEKAVLAEWHQYLTTNPRLDFKVDLIIYLRTSPEIAFSRIQKRQRTEENHISLDYIKTLHHLHENWLIYKTKFQPLPAPGVAITANEDLGILLDTEQVLERQVLEKIASHSSKD